MRRGMLFPLLFALSQASIGFAQEATPPPKLTGPQDEYIDFGWDGLQWRMQKWFYQGVHPAAPDSKQLFLVFRWVSAQEKIFPTIGGSAADALVWVHVRKQPDGRQGLETIRRANLPQSRFPELVSAVFPGMSYITSSSGIHYFLIDGDDVYVSCWSVEPDRSRSKIPLLSQKYNCVTLFELPNATYAWIKASDIDLRESAKALVAAHRKILSFTHQ